MVKLPDVTALDAATPRPSTPGVDFPAVPRFDYVGRALERAGGEVSDLANVLVAKSQQEAEREKAKTEQAQRFAESTRFYQFEQKQQKYFTDSQQNAEPGAKGYPDQVDKDYRVRARQYFQGVPPALKGEYDVKLADLNSRIVESATNFQLREQDRFAKEQIANGQYVLLDRLRQHPEQWDSIEKEGEGYINDSNLSQIEKDAAKQDWRENRGVIKYQTDNAINPVKARQGLMPSTGEGAVGLLRHFEGFRDTPYWDVNHYRVGYGSDTATTADGKVVNVTPGMRVSQADAERDLARRAAHIDAENTATLGDDWKNLDGVTKSALISVAYNYGSLPARLLPAIRSGDKAQIAQAVQALSSDNGGVNAKRRAEEAAVIASGKLPDSIVDPSYAAIPYMERVKLADATDVDIKRQQTEEKAQQTLAANQEKDRLDLGIEDGSVKSVVEITGNGALDDGQKAVLLRRFKEVQGDNIAGTDLVSAMQANEFIDTGDSATKKGANQVFKWQGGGDALVKGDPLAVNTVMMMWGHANGGPVLPEDAKSALTSMTRSTDNGTMLRGLSYLDAMERKNPVAFGQMFGDFQKMVNIYRDRLPDGPQTVAQAIRNQFDPEWIKKYEPIRDQAEKDARKVYDVQKIVGLFDSNGYLPGGKPGAPPVIGDGRELVDDYVRAFSDSVAADAADPEGNALRIVQKTWGASQLNGGALMKNPPEHFYQVDPAALQGILEKDLKEAGYVEASEQSVYTGSGIERLRVETVRPYSLRAIPLTETQIALGAKPQYAVVVRDQTTGEPQVATTKDGKSLLMWPGKSDISDLMRAKAAEFRRQRDEAAKTRRAVEEPLKEYPNPSLIPRLPEDGPTVQGQ